MRRVTVLPGRLSGRVAAVPSKSDAHRALIAAALADGGSAVAPLGESDDVRLTARALERMGLGRYENGRMIGGGAMADFPTVPCGQSGSTLRFLIPLALTKGEGARFTGEGRLMRRPLAVYENLCASQGVAWQLAGDTLTVRGRLRPGDFVLPGDVSSQFVTGLLFALPLLAGDSTLRFASPLQSMPYVRMTIRTLAAFGVTVAERPGGFDIPGGQRYHPCDYAVEGDWSYAAFPLVAGALGGPVTVGGLNRRSLQGDRAIEALLGRMGARLTWGPDGLTAQAGGQGLRPIQADLSDIPDLGPALAVAALGARGESRLTGARRLAAKECDRLAAILDLARDLGGEAIAPDPDTLVIRGRGSLAGGAGRTRRDHRMAMALAVAAGLCRGPVTLDDADCVAKSAPPFWAHFEQLGGACR